MYGCPPMSLHYPETNIRRRNSTLSSSGYVIPQYWDQVDKVALQYPALNYFERLWAAWYAYMGNDVLATGIMSFAMHEIFYFGRSLPWIVIDLLPSIFGKYKIQGHKMPSAKEQWQCAMLVLFSHFTVELPQIW